jgi:hypothetical protein
MTAGWIIIPGAMPGQVHCDYRAAVLAREAANAADGAFHQIVQAPWTR